MTTERLEIAKNIQRNIAELKCTKERLAKTDEAVKYIRKSLKPNVDFEIIFEEGECFRDSVNILYNLWPIGFDDKLKKEILNELNLIGPGGFVDTCIKDLDKLVNHKIEYYNKKMEDL